MKIIKSIFYPYSLKYNPYCNLVENAMNIWNIETLDVKKISSFFKCKIINLNFYENFPKDISKSKAYMQYVLKKIFIVLCKIFRKKIVFVLHNKMQHDAKYYDLNLKLLKYLIKKSDKIVSPCEEGKEIVCSYMGEKYKNKVNVIPLPDYSKIEKKYSVTYNEIEKFKTEYSLNNKLVFLFFGLIGPYKNVDFIIDTANRTNDKDVVFMICGKFSNDKFYHEILNKIKKENVIIKNNFLSDKDLDICILSSDIMLFPMNKISALNSSSIISAGSLGKTCISPAIGTAKMFTKDQLFIYDYNESREHFEQFYKKVQEVIEIYKYNPEIIKKMSLNLNRQIENDNSLENIGKKYRKLYESLL